MYTTNRSRCISEMSLKILMIITVYVTVHAYYIEWHAKSIVQCHGNFN